MLRAIRATREATATLEHRIRSARALALNEERGRIIRSVGGSVALVIADNGRQHRLVATPGLRSPEEYPKCTLSLAMADFVDLQAGRVQPLQLMMTGQLVIEGDAQIVMALVAAFAG